jgi:uncharacterized metal-binding protein
MANSDVSCTCHSEDISNGNCACSSAPVLVFPCSGGSNVGQIANEAAVDLDRSQRARIYCLAGVAAHIPGMVDSAKSASAVVAIDGCPIACAKMALEHAGISVARSIIVTELGIEKKHTLIWDPEDVEKVITAVTTTSPFTAVSTAQTPVTSS